MDKLKIYIQSLTAANEALREVIEIRGDEVGRMEHFEDLFRKASEKFMKFEQMTTKYKSQANELQTRLQQDLNRQRKLSEDLKKQIASLTRAIEEQGSENKHLEEDLKGYVEKLQKLKYLSDGNGAYTSTSATPVKSGPFIQRLCNDLNKTLDF